jgi:hypothetical protein
VIFLCSQARKDSGLNFIGSKKFCEKAVSVPESARSVNVAARIWQSVPVYPGPSLQQLPAITHVGCEKCSTDLNSLHATTGVSTGERSDETLDGLVD